MPQNDEWIREQVRLWQIELGFVDTTIVVQNFFLADDWIGISDLPEHYQHVIDHPDGYEVDRYEELSADIRLWRERGDFVLYWDEEYYLNRDGELESS